MSTTKIFDASLKNRVTVFTLLLCTLMLGIAGWYASYILRTEIQTAVGERQFQATAFAAARIDQELGNRLSALETVAAQVPMDDAAALQRNLSDSAVLASMFSGGLLVISMDGVVLTEHPQGVLAFGIDVAGLSAVTVPLAQGVPHICTPALLQGGATPIFAVGVPITSEGEVTAVLVGVEDIGRSPFFQDFTQSYSGEAGGYFLVARPERLIISATDQMRTMEVLPPIGENPALDRFLELEGVEGFQVYDNPAGIEVITSAKRLSAVDWGVALNMPTEELFAPIDLVRHRIC